MSHDHTIEDISLNFIIDPITRTITLQSDKQYLTQLDHESERLTFGIQRFIEGHDMSMCDRIEIHYTNITKKKDAKSEGVYIVKDTDKSFTSDQFTFSWLVRRESTLHAGVLRFSIAFICHDEDENIIYEWGTTEYKNIQVLTRLEHTVTTIAKYPDLYEQLKQEILDNYTIDESKINEIINEYLKTHPSIGQPGFSPTITIDEVSGGHQVTITDVLGPQTFIVLNGEKGDAGVSGVYVGSDEAPLEYDIQIDPNGDAEEFVTRAEFNQLSEQIDIDILSVLYESGIANLIEDSSGKLYVDENEKIYII